MLKASTFIQLIAIVIVLVVAPSESAPFKANTKPSDWYGEFVLSTNRDISIIAKNSGDKPVTLSLTGIKRTIVMGLGDSTVIDSKALTTIPGQSYSLISLDRNQHNLEEVSTKYATGDNAQLFSAGPLAISTRSDSFDSLALCVIVLACFVVLSYFVGVYCHERSPLFAGKKLE
jgi:hypothetical protein